MPVHMIVSKGERERERRNINIQNVRSEGKRDWGGGKVSARDTHKNTSQRGRVSERGDDFFFAFFQRRVKLRAMWAPRLGLSIMLSRRLLESIFRKK